MIGADERKGIYMLHTNGMSLRSISRQLGFSRNTIKDIINEKGEMPETINTSKIEVDEILLRELFSKCNGWIQRVHEILTEEKGISIGYSTLTRQIRELGIGEPQDNRSCRVPDEPGVEMQHDTSTYTVANWR